MPGSEARKYRVKDDIMGYLVKIDSNLGLINRKAVAPQPTAEVDYFVWNAQQNALLDAEEARLLRAIEASRRKERHLTHLAKKYADLKAAYHATKDKMERASIIDCMLDIEDAITSE